MSETITESVARLKATKKGHGMSFQRMTTLARAYAGTLHGKAAVIRKMHYAAHPENIYKELERRTTI